MKISKWKGYGLPALLILGGFAVRLWGLTATSLWYDEAFMLYHAQRGVAAGVLGLLAEDNALPLHGLLLSLWVTVAGNGEFAARYLSVLLGTLALPLVWRLSQALTGDRAGGWGAALACATLPIQVYYAQEVRMYALAVPLAAAFAWLTWRVVMRGRGELGYVLCGAAMLTAHLYTGLLWAALLLWGTVALLGRERSRWRGWLFANGGLMLTALPIAGWALWRAGADATAVAAIPLEVLRWLPEQFGVGQYLSQPWAGLFIALLGGLLALAVWSASRERRWAAALWVLMTVALPVLLLLALTLVKAKWSERYLLPSLGLGPVVGAGMGLAWLWQHRQWWGAVAAVLWLALTLPAVGYQAQGTRALGIIDEWHPRPDFRGVGRYLTAEAASDDVIVVVAGYAAHTLAYYYDGPAEIVGLPPDSRLLDTRQPMDLRSLSLLAEWTADASRIWLVLWQEHLADPTGLTTAVLLDQCPRLPVPATFTNVALLSFEGALCAPLDQSVTPPLPLDVAFVEPVRLTGYGVTRADETWAVDLWWETTAPMPNTYAAFVHLVAADGTLVSQHDRIVGADRYPLADWAPGTQLRDRFFLVVPDGACEGCVLRVGLYNERGRLPLTDGADFVTLLLP